MTFAAFCARQEPKEPKDNGAQNIYNHFGCYYFSAVENFIPPSYQDATDNRAGTSCFPGCFFSRCFSIISHAILRRIKLQASCFIVSPGNYSYWMNVLLLSLSLLQLLPRDRKLTPTGLGQRRSSRPRHRLGSSLFALASSNEVGVKIFN